MVMPPVRIVSMEGDPLSVPLREPFVIATGRMDVTRAVLVRVTVEADDGRRAIGYGEAAALPPVTHEDQPELLRAAAGGAMALVGTRVESFAECEDAVSTAVPHSVVARAGVEAAVLDGWARLAGVPLARALAPEGDDPLPVLTTDITLPIAEPAAMASLAARYAATGFATFKVKVGRDWRADRAALEAVARAVPNARFILDANGGFSATDALSLLEAVLTAGLVVDCYEQPCAREDLAGMAAVTARSPVPVV
ncbi:MAG TPA: enolase C-terminal domain-like protein, partial [Polyangia bacterium]|nr:enolase C-terminal domain-like protein [Polyangia bacterium]